MIPKIIHYVWLGKKPLPRRLRGYVEGWKRFCPGWTIKRWDESNIPKNIAFLENAIENKHYATASDFLRLYSLYSEGGIYLDTDVEMIKPFDDFLKEELFFGFQEIPVGGLLFTSVNNAVMGSKKGHYFLKEIMDKILVTFSGKEATCASGPYIIGKGLVELGLMDAAKDSRTTVRLGDIAIFPSHYFYPYPYWEKYKPGCVRADTYAVHHWSYSWVKLPPLPVRAFRKFLKVTRLDRIVKTAS